MYHEGFDDASKLIRLRLRITYAPDQVTLGVNAQGATVREPSNRHRVEGQMLLAVYTTKRREGEEGGIMVGKC